MPIATPQTDLVLLQQSESAERLFIMECKMHLVLAELLKNVRKAGFKLEYRFHCMRQLQRGRRLRRNRVIY